jgi:hypothetical protein
MWSLTVDLEGADTAEAALERFRQQVVAGVAAGEDERPLLEIKLTGQVGFHPFELGRERLWLVLADLMNPLHAEIRNHLSLLSRGPEKGAAGKGLAEIEKEVLRELVKAGSDYRGREEELVRLALAMRDLVLKGETDGDELLGLLEGEE